MFDFFDPGKLMIVAIVALLVIGPKDLPRVLRTVGNVVGKMRRMAAEFQGQFMDALKEAELDDLKKELTSIGESAKIEGSFDPTTLMRDEMSASIEGPKILPPAKSEIFETNVVSPPEAETLPLPFPEPPPARSAEALPEAADAPLVQSQKG
jgi:sec-independent protein translocase protein TatB